MVELQPLALSAQDLLALSMVALLSFALGMIITILFVMARSGAKTPDLETDFFEEKEESSFKKENTEAAGDQPAEAPPKDLWEKDPDWWKK